jgi:hypothetical protein
LVVLLRESIDQVAEALATKRYLSGHEVIAIVEVVGDLEPIKGRS